jgi:hypothetical protein
MQIVSSISIHLLLRRTALGIASVDQWSEILATDSEVPGSILGPTRFSEK